MSSNKWDKHEKFEQKETAERELKTYNKWEDVPANLKTTPALREMGLEPIDNRKPAGKIVLKEIRKEYKLYDISKTKKIKKPPAPLPFTKENFVIAFYTVNKAAKMRRDAVEEARDIAHRLWEDRDYEACGLFTREAKIQEDAKKSLYELKYKVLQKALADGIAVFVGVHRQIRIVQEKIYDTPEDYDNDNCHYEDFERETFLGCYKIGSYHFHTILASIPENNQSEIKDLGIWLSSTTTTGCIRLKEAIRILKKYLESSINEGVWGD